MNDRNDILFFNYFLMIFYDYMSRDLSHFYRSAKHREQGEQIKALLNFKKLGEGGKERRGTKERVTTARSRSCRSFGKI